MFKDEFLPMLLALAVVAALVAIPILTFSTSH